MSHSSHTSIGGILDRAVAGERLSPQEGVALLRSHDLTALGAAADAVTQRLHPEPFRTYNIDRNINYSNVCAAVCDFCAFYRPVGHSEAYVLTEEVLHQKIQETVELGGDQILLQGGLHPQLPLEWYEDLLRGIKTKFPQVNVHGFSPPEIYFFHKLTKLPLKTVLERLKAAGLGSLPGGGGEILVDRVRKQITRGKVLTDGWLEVNQVWHELGGRSSCTMMFGHVETLEERIEHLDRLRRQQDETGGFTAFICWTHQPPHQAPWFGHDALLPVAGTVGVSSGEEARAATPTDGTRSVPATTGGRKGGVDMSQLPPAGAFEYLKTQAVARLYLDNIPNIQSSWVTQGEKVGQMALHFGANDMGSLMIEENVVAQAGTVFHLSLETIRRCITDAGYIPRQRNVFYDYIDAEPEGVAAVVAVDVEEVDDDDCTRSIELGVHLPVVM
jgi:cyclic dehypoxanthinyl futalosine synthase